MEEQETIEVGMYCHNLLLDPQFNKLVSLCESNISLQILQEERLDNREKWYYIYQGLKELLNMMQQFVTAKDQIAAKQNEEDNE